MEVKKYIHLEDNKLFQFSKKGTFHEFTTAFAMQKIERRFSRHEAFTPSRFQCFLQFLLIFSGYNDRWMNCHRIRHKTRYNLEGKQERAFEEETDTLARFKRVSNYIIFIPTIEVTKSDCLACNRNSILASIYDNFEDWALTDRN